MNVEFLEVHTHPSQVYLSQKSVFVILIRQFILIRIITYNNKFFLKYFLTVFLTILTTYNSEYWIFLLIRINSLIKKSLQSLNYRHKVAL